MNTIEAIRILGLPDDFTPEQLKKKYRSIARKVHPDIAGEQSNELFIKVNEAYEILSNSGKVVADKILTHSSIFTVVRA